ncbi:MAG: hypothetical protein M3021_11450 [Actinomycetota bacterium]|nr:hypothetical protein [Actinomycetota bacterium]
MRHSPGLARLPRLRLLLLLAVALCSLTPLAVHAGTPGAHPAAVQVVFSAQVRAGAESLALDGTVTVNRTGDMHLSVTLTNTERHTLDVILVDDALYASADGGAYEVGSVKQILGDLAGSLPSGLLNPAATMSMALPASCLQPLIPSGAAGLQALSAAGIAVSQGDGGTIAGVATSLLSVHADVARALASFGTLVRSVGMTCGLWQDDMAGLVQASSPQVQQVFAGAALDISVYSGQADDFPRRVSVALDLPNLPYSLQFRADLTPLAAPVPIAPPANSTPVGSGR